ncbi:hypothetical protein OUY22_06200 [Nonomuraea sp. MCN248]|uniref:Chitinase n=1 Tax=Nonomuraea corallina TaxID=2989783 RepID=A0ABT4S7M4_9ACTN|nr:hypothetical protein [Nonomuraea corallina]MDA0633005.1 hypothetical protein [Nonomuraea corallina]
MSASRRSRPSGTLPRPLTFLAAAALTTATATAVSLLPAQAGLHRAAPVPAPSSPRAVPGSPPAASPSQPGPSGPGPSGPGPSGFVTFVDTAADPGFDLPADARRTGVRWYALGHLSPASDGCAQRWAGRLAFGHDPVANRVGRLRALGGDAGLVFGGPAGEAAATCTRPDALTAAYRRAVGAFDAAYVEFELSDPGDRATVLRRARAIGALQRERPLRAGFTLPLRADGLTARDAEMLRLTREAGADIATVNVLARIEPQAAPEGRLRRLALALRAARVQVARAYGLASADEAWPRLALTCVPAGPADLSAADARALLAFAARHRLAWLSLRGAEPDPEAARILRG